jgi:hypothetical protein
VIDPDRLQQWRDTALGIVRSPEPPLSVEAGVILAEYLLDACEETERLRAAWRCVSVLIWVAGGHVFVPDRVLLTLRDDDVVTEWYDPAAGGTHYEVRAAAKVIDDSRGWGA